MALNSQAPDPHGAREGRGFPWGRSVQCLALTLAVTLLSSCASSPVRESSVAPLPVAAAPHAVSAPAKIAQPDDGLQNTEPVLAQAPLAVQAPPQVDDGLRLRAWVEQQGRIYRVASPLLINNTELCPQHARRILGFTAKNKYSYSSDFISLAESALGLNDELQVMHVLAGSGAELAGVRKGDVLLAVEIEPIPKGPDAEHAAAKLIGSEMEGRESLYVSVRRDGQRMGFDIPLTMACGMVLDLGNADEPGSFSDGQRVLVTRGMLDFVRSDAELAYVLAREIARNEMMPGSRPEITSVIERLHALESSITSAEFSTAMQPLESDIDSATEHLALDMLERAGYDVANYRSFLQRLASLPASSVGNRSAPDPSSAPYRISVLHPKAKDDAFASGNSTR
ncbi:peptidase M48 [Noviherbaspirillum sp.]|uniref:peptidase M48 n=1 Tax=Noviherbaspirillum sp. TaxID=1926288 RepID=UPI002B477537|nr:peptidase M48 [Noviherbaspirillum sp.]HJV79920.1 peptidase M48 [Noviherbaspirillum sp.]